MISPDQPDDLIPCDERYVTVPPHRPQWVELYFAFGIALAVFATSALYGDVLKRNLESNMTTSDWIWAWPFLTSFLWLVWIVDIYTRDANRLRHGNTGIYLRPGSKRSKYIPWCEIVEAIQHKTSTPRLGPGSVAITTKASKRYNFTPSYMADPDAFYEAIARNVPHTARIGEAGTPLELARKDPAKSDTLTSETSIPPLSRSSEIVTWALLAYFGYRCINIIGSRYSFNLATVLDLPPGN